MSEYLHQKIRRPAPPQISHLCRANALPNVFPIIYIVEGTIVSFTPRRGRTPDLYTVQYVGGFTERLTAEEVRIGISYMEKRLTSCLPTGVIDHERERFTHYENIMKERYDMGMEIKVSHEVIWKLILVAAMEIEYEHRVSERFQTLQATSEKVEGFGSNSMRYYREHPTSYLGGQYIPPAKKEELSNEGQVVFAPNLVAQRMRTGISKACNFYQSKVVGDPLESRRSSRIASSSSGPVTKPNILEVGGCVALTLLKIFQEIDDAANHGNAGELLRDDAENSNEKLEVAADDGDDEINQFFNPTSLTLFNHLKAGRSTTATDIQTAFCYAMEDSIPTTLPLIDLTQLTDDLKADPYLKVTLVCASGERLKDLQSYETNVFARCKFNILLEDTADEFVEAKEPDAQQIVADFRAEEKAWKARKHFETWRYQSVMGGTTIWPSWSSFVSDSLKRQIVSTGDQTATTNESALVTGEGSNQSDIKTINGEQKQEADDLALAKAIAEPATSRRSRRAARGDTADGPIFYGANQSLTAQQIVETLYRVIAQAHSKGMTLLDLKKLIMGDGERSGNTPITELKKIRVALGKLMFRLGKVNRMLVSSNSDEECWQKISTAVPLVKITFLPPLPTKSPSLNTAKTDRVDVTNNEPDLVNGQEALQISTKNADQVDNKESDIFETKRNQEISGLEDYIRNLHETELILRGLILKHSKTTRGVSTFQQIPPSLLALSADEKVNETDSYDWDAFRTGAQENGDHPKQDISWIVEPSHPLIGKMIYRPSIVNDEKVLHLDPGALSGCWYKIVSYCPPVIIEELSEDKETAKEGNNNSLLNSLDNGTVGRRIRFRAEPVSPTNHIGNLTNIPDNEEKASWIVLTEAQVHAGIDAAILKKEYYSEKETNMRHPFQGRTGMRYLLYKTTNGVEDGPIQALIAGHESVLSSNAKGVDFRVLVLPEEDGISNDRRSGFWASLSDDASIMTVVESDTMYRLEQQEYHQSSPAYETCESVLSYLKSNVKIVPFLEPVDPVALNIPDYFDTIDKPMDLSTVEKNLTEGKYGRVPSGGSYNSPVGKMLNGPFYEDIMLIFDNAMTYNPKGDWIHNDAHILKGLAKKKIETLATKAERQHNGFTSIPTSSSRTQKSTSVYVDENSDVDMYEYESDYDDDYGDSTSSRKRTKKRSRGLKTASKVEDYSTRAIENLVSIPHKLDASLIATLPIATDVRNFALPLEWTCEKSFEKKDDGAHSNEGQEIQEREKISMLHSQLKEVQSSSVRRSARSQPSAVKHSGDVRHCLSGIGYAPHSKYHAFIKDVMGASFSTEASDRADVESIRETLHEECYAYLYYKYCSSHATTQVAQESTSEDGSGIYCDGSFPPYLGRVVPNSRLSDVTWEIKAEFVVPALRWVLRGLVQSGHLAEWESFSLSTYDIETLLLPNHVYYCDAAKSPFAILDPRRKKVETLQEEEEEEEEVELSAYEQMRAKRVARNKERLKELGLA